jgi:L-threonylcarbamoyladenylate synthase
MEIIRINPINPDKNVLKKTKQFLDQGKIIAHPTETIYGLAASVQNNITMQRVFDIKGRDPEKPMSVMLRDIKAINQLIGTINTFEEQFIKKFLPGPITVILEIRKKTDLLFLKNRKTLGIRIPDHKFCSELLKIINYPICSTSANKSGAKDPLLAMEIISHFQDEIDLLIDGGMTKSNIPSTIVDLSQSPIKILREGPISSDDIYRFIENIT